MATISSDILASYAADAALEVDGVRSLVPSSLHRHKGVRVFEEDGQTRVELHVATAWGASIPAVGSALQEHVASYLMRMAHVSPARIDVVVDEVGPP